MARGRSLTNPGDPNNGAAGLTSALAFLLMCALMYYSTEFSLVSGYRADVRANKIWRSVSSQLAQAYRCV